MVAMEPVPGENNARKRRPYKKSRHGCRNCKLRRVKCDETKPRCGRCRDYGVFCNFDATTGDLQVAASGSQCQQIDSFRQMAFHGTPAPQLRFSIVSRDEATTFEMDAHSMARLERFRDRIGCALANSTMIKAWEDELLPAAFTNPFLMHTVLAAAATHDRYLSMPASGRRTVAEAYHASQCVMLFNQKLSGPILPCDRDPLWATAALLVIIVFSSFEAATPEDAWPLHAPQPSDLEWLTLSDGKRAIWKLTDPLRPGGIFRAMADEYAQLSCPIPRMGVDDIAPALIELCGLSAASTADNNPYFAEAYVVSRLQKLPDPEVTSTRALTFLSHMQPSYKDLLRKKDPVALLLLALWYSRASRSAWWIAKRAQVECHAIYLYIQRHHCDQSRILQLLPRLPSDVMRYVSPIPSL